VQRVDENTVSMHVEEYRFFITRIKTLEAENESLHHVLKLERASFDEVTDAAKAANEARLEEREAADSQIKKLETWIKHYKAAQWQPGVIGGGGVTTGGDVEGFVGVGWKMDLW
jgi:hypothetical protein